MDESKMNKVLILACCMLMTTACSDFKKSSDEKDKIYLRQSKEYDEQSKKVKKQQVEVERQLNLAAEQLSKSAAQQRQMEQLLLRWEKQADRYDMILNSWEKKDTPK